MWDAMFQSWDDAGVDKVGDDSYGRHKGMWGAPADDTPTFDPFTQSSAVSTAAPQKDGSMQIARRPSNHIGAPSMTGIYNATNVDPNGPEARQSQFLARQRGQGRR